MSTKITKTILIVALFAFITGQAFAYKYVVNDAATYSYVSATTQFTVLSGGDLDDGWYDYALGDFDFYFYGRKVTHLRISTNGYIVFGFGSATGVGNGYDNTPLPDYTALLAPDGMAAVQWDDWVLLTGGTMWYDVIGTAPNRTLVIEWRNVASYSGWMAGTPEQYNFEAILYEKSNNILYQYADVEDVTSHNYGQQATIGVEHPTGLQADQYSYNEIVLADGDAILLTPYVHVYGTTDFNGDGRPDATMWRASDSTWYVRNVQNWTVTANRGDIPVPGDYDGDGMAYRAMFTPSTNMWHTEIGDIAFGTVGDIPVPADYNGDGLTDIAVWRPSNGRYYIYGPMGGVKWGTAGDIPMPFDRNGDGRAEFVVFRPSNGHWYVYGPLGGVQWGTDGDVPVPFDRDGDGSSEFVVGRPTNGRWYVYGPLGGVQWGMAGDVFAPADVNGDGPGEFVVWRPTNGHWYVYGPLGGFTFGAFADVPMLRK
jgi:hypothetical protein